MLMPNIYLAVRDALQIGKQIFRIKKSFRRYFLRGIDTALTFANGYYMAWGGAYFGGRRDISADASGAGRQTVYLLQIQNDVYRRP